MPTLDLNPHYTGPATHALIIGAGDYRHLHGGAEPGPDVWGLGQLPGASVSAKCFLDWLRERFHNPAAPIATIEHLISGPEGRTLGSQEPTMASVVSAFDRWFARTSKHPENVAVFYFSGHGVLKGTDTGLLAADFAMPNGASLMRNAVHVEETVQGMLRCRANKQCFIIDACRTMEEPLLEAMTRPGVALATASARDVRPIPQPILFASGLNQASYQVVNAVSPFTKALIESLEAMGADDVSGSYAPGQCVVDTTSLLRGIKASMELDRRKRPFLPPQDAVMGGNGSFSLHYPKHQILVPLIVGCEPAALNPKATLLVRQNGTVLHTRPPADADLEVPLTPDSYEAVANLPPDRVACGKVLVIPPYRERRLSEFVAVPPGGI